MAMRTLKPNRGFICCSSLRPMHSTCIAVSVIGSSSQADACDKYASKQHPEWFNYMSWMS